MATARHKQVLVAILFLEKWFQFFYTCNLQGNAVKINRTSLVNYEESKRPPSNAYLSELYIVDLFLAVLPSVIAESR